jgi:sialate O-acetylesterase
MPYPLHSALRRMALFCALLGLFLVSPARAQDAPRPGNLLPNPSFEEPAGGGVDEKLVPGWQVRFRINGTEAPLTAAEVSLVDDPAQAHTGRRCVRLQPGAQRNFYGISLSARADNGQPLAPGLYELSAWFRGRPGTRANFSLHPIGSQQQLMGVGDAWTRNRVVHYFPGGASAPFEFIIYKEGERGQIKEPLLFVDDCSVRRLSSGVADVFGDHMVVQREKPVPVWGWTERPNQPVILTFNGQTRTATSDADGRWEVTLAPMTAGGPFVLEVDGRPAACDVMVGDVWLCTGQSNMEMGVDKLNGIWGTAPEILAKAAHPEIRLWHAAKQFSPQPLRNYRLRQDVWYSEYQACWNVCSPSTVGRGGWGGFSAVGYFFGRAIQADQKVAVGLMQVAHGGTAIEAWMSPEALEKIPRAGWRIPPIEGMEADKVKIVPLPAPPAGATTPAYAEAIAVVQQGETHKAFNYAGACFNGLLSPVFPMAVRGVLWYQGEHNSADPLYAEKLTALITDWRARLRDPALPVIISQLCNWQTNDPKQNFAIVRDGQLRVSRSLPRTALVVTLDLADRTGEAGFPYGPAEIHPHRKREVGERNALAARALAYGQKVVASGPIFSRCTPEGGKLRLTFDSVGGGLTAQGDKLVGFTLAGADRQFVPAAATIDGATVLVSAPGVAAPVAARYGFAHFVQPLCNLYNTDGLPASPFRTDDWALGAEGK